MHQDPAVTYENGCPVIHVREGLSLKIQAGEWTTPCNVLVLALWASSKLGGKPVRFGGLLPGVSLLAVANFPPDLADVDRLSQQWESFEPKLRSWVEAAHWCPHVTLRLPAASATLGLDKFVTLEHGAMSVTIEHPWEPRSRAPEASTRRRAA